jgi:uncharacterized protein YdaU (DUF1376 family)
MPLYIGDYLRKTMHLTIDQHGAYLMLIMACWCEGGTLPNSDDTLAAICRVPITRWRKLRPIMLRYFQVDDAGWHNNRVCEELAKAEDITEHRRSAGHASARARAQQNGSKRVTSVVADPTEGDRANKPSKSVTNVATPVAQPLQQNPRPSPSPKGSVATTEPTTYKNLTSELVAARATDENQGFLRKFEEVQGGRCAPLEAAIARNKRDNLVQKLIKYSRATLAEPQLSAAVGGLCGADPIHDDQWWLDHLDKKMRDEQWDDAERISA